MTASSRVSPFESYSLPPPSFSTPLTFPEPPRTSSTRNLVPTAEGVSHASPSAALIVGEEGNTNTSTSSVFEWADYTINGRESLATMTSREAAAARQTMDWYEKPLWDTQTDCGSAYGGVEGDEGGSRVRMTSRSVKSIRWGDEEALARASEGGRAL